MAKPGHLALLTGVLLSAMVLTARAEQSPATASMSQRLANIVWPPTSGTTTRHAGGVAITTGKDTTVERLPDQVQTSAVGGKTHTYVYKLTRGRLDISVKRGGRSRYSVLVMAPEGLTGAVLGGRGIAEVDQHNISFTARHQAMLIGKGSHSRQLAEGQTLAIDRKKGGFHQVGLPKPPELFIEQAIALSVPRVGFETTVRFKPSEDIRSYEVALLKQNASGWLPVATGETHHNHLTLRGTEAGRYAVMARSLNRFGVESEPSNLVALRAIGVAVPDGASITDTGIFLSPSQHVRLLDTEGLKMSQGLGPYIVDAPSSLSLGRSKHAHFRVWDPTTQSKLHLQLFARTMRADISIGSAIATWPRDEINATVSLVNDAGRPLKDTRGVSVNVSVNLKPVSVKWKKLGHQLSGRILQPRALPGPWVIRVEVKDAQGVVVGRDFLEVAKSPNAPD